MTQKEEILNLLQAGRHNAVQSAYICNRTGLTDKFVRAAIKEMIEDDGLLIGSTPHAPAGFYLVSGPDELDVACRQLLSRAYSILYRVSRLKKISLDQTYQQMKLWGEF